MEEIKTTLPELDGNKKDDDDKDTVKYMMFLFIPLIVITILCFRYYTLRMIVLFMSGFFMCYTSYKTYKARANRFDKEILSQVILVACTILAIFFKFFGDLVLAYMALLFVCLLFMLTQKLEESKQKKYITYYVFFGSIITAIILNYNGLILLFHKVVNYF
jgi:uncharacterized membrane protein HdeD (DUF308 family)